MPRSDELRVSPVPRVDQDAVRNWLIGRGASSDVLALDDTAAPPRWLVQARRKGELVGAAWGQLLSPRTAYVAPALVVADEPDDTARKLHQVLDAELRQSGLHLVQSIVPTSDDASRRRLLAAGYAPVAELLYLVGFPDRGPKAQPPGDPTLESYDAGQPARLIHVVERTYVGTLDCPAVEGLRDVHDVLDGYRAAGPSGDAWWFLARSQHQDVGCLLLAVHPVPNSCELIYMGIVPEARGRGWGSQLVQHALWQCRCAGCSQLVLGVDAANYPAVASYLRAGLVIWERRAVLLKKLSAD